MKTQEDKSIPIQNKFSDYQAIFEEKSKQKSEFRKLDGLVISIQEKYEPDMPCKSCSLSCLKMSSKFSCKHDLGNPHQEGSDIAKLFSRLSKKVEHLRNPSID